MTSPDYTCWSGMRAAGAAFLLFVMLNACVLNGERSNARRALVRDSAGVEIVENRDPIWTDETRWSIDATPSLTIGVEEGDPLLEFYQLSDVRQLGDGRIVAMNAGTNELRFFSADGSYLCSSGRQGAGPGDFENMSWLQLLSDDTIVVYSSGGGPRLSLIDAAGVFQHTLPMPRVEDAQVARPDGFLSDGVLVMRVGTLYTTEVTSGTHRATSVLILFDRGGKELGRIGPMPVRKGQSFVPKT
jgi:hypothetical protein